MKKIICFNILLLMLLLSGCANKQEMQKVQQTHDIEMPESGETEIIEQDHRDNTDTSADAIDVSNTITEEVDLSDEFRGINGCAVIYDLENNKYSIYNTSLSEQQVSPYSTFKIVSTLAGLKNEVIENQASRMNYDGVQYPVAEWNENLTLDKAFQASCIWYFRQVIDEVGRDEIQNELTQLEYGNCDISEWDGSNLNPMPELNGFWLDSSLKISPLEQVQVLKKIFEGESIYSDDHVAILKEIMLVSEDTQKIYGKTGSSSNGEAWFVGFTEENEQRVYFAVYLNDNTQPDQVSGSMAKEIALDIFK